MNTSFLSRGLRGAVFSVALSLAIHAFPAAAATSKVELTVQWHGSQRSVVIELDESAAPKTCANFKKLASLGFYNGVAFHRVIPGYIAQAGDPLSKDAKRRADWGTGGPGYVIPAEIRKPHVRGAVATARLGDQANPSRASSGSQFYIALTDIPSLNDSYTVFGKVVSGMEFVDAMAMLATDENNNPLDRIEIVSATIISDSGAKLPDPGAVTVAETPPVAASSPPAKERERKAQAATPSIPEPAPASTVASTDAAPMADDEKEPGGFLPFFKKKPEPADSGLPTISEPAGAGTAASTPPEPKPQPKPKAEPAPARSLSDSLPSSLPAMEANPIADSTPSGGPRIADEPPAPSGSAPLMGPTNSAAAPKPASSSKKKEEAPRGPVNRFFKRFW